MALRQFSKEESPEELHQPCPRGIFGADLQLKLKLNLKNKNGVLVTPFLF